MMSKYLYSLIILMVLSAFGTKAYCDTQAFRKEELKHTNDSTANKEKNLKFSILGGPGYTPDFGVLIGGAALFTFRTDRQDSLLQRSVMPLSFGVTFAKPIGLNVMVKPQIFFKGDKMRLFGQFIYKNTNDNYYGVGYKTNKSIQRSDTITQFSAKMVQINPILTFNIPNSHFYVGALYDMVWEKVMNPGKYILSDPLYIKQIADNNNNAIFSSGLGVIASYDTRDVAANAYKGVYFEMKATAYAKLLGSEFKYQTLNFDYRQYKALPFLGERRTLAWSVISKNAFGDVPFTRYPLIGSPFDLRGYYMGQYRDKSTLIGLVEYRHMFNFDKSTKTGRFFSRFGFAAWGGSGFMGPNPVKYEVVLPNYGAGLRLELQPRMNFRIDVGRSPIDKQNLLYFNMTESF